MFTKALASFIAVLCLFSSPVASAIDSSDPYIMVSAADKMFDRLRTERSQIENDPEMLRTIVTDELLPFVDHRFSALKVLGKHMKSVPRKKIPEFINVFRQYLVTTFALALSQYDNQLVEFEPAKSYEGKKSLTVRAFIKEAGRPDIKLAFKLRLNKKTNQWKAYDMVVEGISLLSSKRSELETVLRQQGIDEVIKMITEKNAKPITIAEAKESE